MMKSKQYKVITVLFLAALAVFAVITDIKYINFYLNDVTYNEEWIPDLGRKNETDYMTCFFGKEVLIDLNGGVQRLLGTPEMNKVVRLSNGHLSIPHVAVAEDRLLSEADDVAYLYEYLKKRDIPFLYVAVPDTIAKYDKELPIGYDDETNENLDVFLAELSAKGVPYVDMREEFAQAGLDQYDYYFNTDHHWTMPGGFFAYTRIADWLDSEAGVAVSADLTDPANYEVNHFDNAIVGSYGQRTGKLFSGTEGIDILTPGFETDLLRTMDNEEGTFSDVLVHWDLIEEGHPQHLYDRIFEYSYSGFENRKIENDSRIMMICDSSGKVVNPFLVLSVRYFDVMEAYYPENLSREYIEGVHPDAIILMQSPSFHLGVDTSFHYSWLQDWK